jgi:dTDP-4-amino-4,6-dideoxygalactose transaminase
MKIGFNKPYQTGNESYYISDAIKRQHISGNGYYTGLCHRFFEQRFGYLKVLLTNSCTDALEMAAILLNIQKGDEVIVPSYTFTSSANAFILRGAKIVFADSESSHPNMDVAKLKPLINSKTKVIVAVHYGGIACDMDELMALAKKHNIFVVEDAAQAIDASYKGKPLGGIGHLGCMSFHESKNITCGEGGLLIINDKRFVRRAEIIWEKGTNRAAFSRGEVSKYEWKDVGSSFLASELNAAFLYAQLEQLDALQNKRRSIWNEYYERLSELGKDYLPVIPWYASNNWHSFYLVCKSAKEKKNLQTYLNENGIQAIGHYVPLHRSSYFKKLHDKRLLNNTIKFAGCLLRLPIFYSISSVEREYIIEHIKRFFHLIKEPVTKRGNSMLVVVRA